MSAKVKKVAITPIIIILIFSLLCVPAFASAYCVICHQDSTPYCTGVDRSGDFTHYQHTFLGWGWGWECNYHLYQHWVATSCCNADVGNHVYKESSHSYCGAVEVPMACSDVPNWSY